MSTEINQQWVLAKRPNPDVSEDLFRLETIDYPNPPADDEILVRTTFISVDPYMRLRMNETNYFQSFVDNEPLDGGVTGEVLLSNSPDYQPGDKIQAFLKWKRFQIVNTKISKIQKLPNDIPSSYFLGMLGMPGLSAYFPLVDYGQITPEDTVFVSGAAGAVGLTVGQIAKNLGAKRVIGSAGTAEKIELTKSLRYDDSINYKTEDLDKALKEKFPEGIDIYWDNVGGQTLEIVLEHMRPNGRIIMCGSISQYNTKREEAYGVKNLFNVVGKKLKIYGFLVSDWFPKFPEGVAQLVTWTREEKLVVKETVVEGFENLPKGFIGLFQGDNLGKMIIKV
jgi:NADPH-dependent curcumin reductase CurA